MNRKVKARIKKLNDEMKKSFARAVKDIKKIDDSYEIYNNGSVYVNHFTEDEIEGENAY